MLFNILKKSIRRTCYVYTVLSFLYLLIMLDLYRDNAGFSPLTILRFLPFAFLVALAHTIATETKWRTSAKLLAHFLLVTVGLVFFVWFPYRTGFSSGTNLALFAIYILLYAVGAFLTFLFLASRKKKKDKTSAYHEVYGERNRK